MHHRDAMNQVGGRKETKKFWYYRRAEIWTYRNNKLHNNLKTNSSYKSRIIPEMPKEGMKAKKQNAQNV